MSNNLKRRIMARIYFEYIKNIFLEYSDYFMFALFLVISFMLISIQDVLVNIPKDNFSNIFNFFIVALRNTSWVIQALIAGFIIRITIAGSKLTYKNMKNSNINADWIMTKLKY